MFLPPHLPLTLPIMVRAAASWRKHGASSIGAAIAFYTLVSLPPAIAIMLQMASFMLDASVARDALISQVQLLWGADAAATTSTIAHYAVLSRAANWGPWVAGVTAIVTASTVFVEMRRSLDLIWDDDSTGAVRSFVTSRLTAFASLIILGGALWVSSLLSTLLATADSRYFDRLGISAIAIAVAGNVVAGMLIMILLTMLYKLLPRHRVNWIDAICGAFVVTCLYLAGKGLIGYYLSKTTIATAFGGGIAGALIVLLLWFYYSAQIFLYGAEVSHEVALARQAGVSSGQGSL